MPDDLPIVCRPHWSPVGPRRPARGTCGLWGPPRLRLHRLTLPQWQLADLRIAVISDPHVNHPWMSPARLTDIVAQVNRLGADLILIAGDLLADRNMPCKAVAATRIVGILNDLSAALGVFAVMGNHDWKDCPETRQTRGRRNAVISAFTASDIALVRNGAVALRHGSETFWLVMTDSQTPWDGLDAVPFDADTAFARVSPGACAILLAHEPDCFAGGDDRACLQISGHTHGGQFTLFGRRPMTPSRFGDRYADGHVHENGRHLVVSAGIGYSGLPFRFGVPPEITLIDLRPATADTGSPPGAAIAADAVPRG